MTAACPLSFARLALLATCALAISAPGDGVTILVGEHLSFIRKEDPRSPGASVDVVQGDVIYAEVKTNADGTFAIPMPLGAYSLIIWKQGYIPEERVNVSVWPGDYFCKLLLDDQPGGTGRHLTLDTTSQNIPRKKIDPRPGIRGVVKLSDRGIRTRGEAVTVLVGHELRLAHPIIPDPTDQVLGKLLIARAETNRDGEFFVPVPAGTYHLIVWKAGYIPQEFDTVVVPPGVHNVTLVYDNQPGSSGRHQKLDTRGVNESGVMARLVVVAGAGKDGRQVAFLARAPESNWAQHAATFDAILASVKLPGATAVAPPQPPTEDLKEFNRVARIPDFKADFAFVAYEDRATITDATGKYACRGVGIPLAAGRVGAVFASQLPDLAQAVAEPALRPRCRCFLCRQMRRLALGSRPYPAEACPKGYLLRRIED